MSPFHRNSPYFALAVLGLAGLFCTLTGFYVLNHRWEVASAFLGARFFLGVPVQDIDTYKILTVAETSGAAVVIGLAMIVLGIVMTSSQLSRTRSFPTVARPS